MTLRHCHYTYTVLQIGIVAGPICQQRIHFCERKCTFVFHTFQPLAICQDHASKYMYASAIISLTGGGVFACICIRIWWGDPTTQPTWHIRYQHDVNKSDYMHVATSYLTTVVPPPYVVSVQFNYCSVCETQIHNHH